MSQMGIAILPHEDFMRALIDFQSRLKYLVHGPTLGLETNLPHISILQCPFVSGIDYQQLLAAILPRRDPDDTLSLVPVNVSYQSIGWLFLNIQRVPWLVRLQKAALPIAERFIDFSGINTTESLAGYSALERSNYCRYGYRYLGDAFRPHVTLGRVHNEPDPETLKEISKSFGCSVGYTERPADRLAFYRAGQFGALVELVADLPLK